MRQNRVFDIDAFWERLCKWAFLLTHMLGRPAAFARMRLSAAAREDVLARLQPLEQGVRRVLLLEALALPKPETLPAPRVRETGARKTPAAARRAPGVSFRLLPRQPRPGKRSRGYPYRQRPSSYSAAPLARRFEAVLRVMTDRTGYVQRLAASIHAEPAGTYFTLSYSKPRSRAAEALLHGADDAAMRAICQLNYTRGADDG